MDKSTLFSKVVLESAFQIHPSSFILHPFQRPVALRPGFAAGLPLSEAMKSVYPDYRSFQAAGSLLRMRVSRQADTETGARSGDFPRPLYRSLLFFAEMPACTRGDIKNSEEKPILYW